MTTVPLESEPEERELSFAEFGEQFLRRVLHRERVLESIDRILGEEIALGPIKAGPGRRFATLHATGRFEPCSGEEVPGDELAYLVRVPVNVNFELAVPLDRHRFNAKVVVPLRVSLRLVDPITILWDLTPPQPEEVELTLTNEARRSAVLQRIAGIDGELRHFLTRFIDRELSKPHVTKARRIPIAELIDNAWEPIACQFLPNSPEDRRTADEPAD